MPKSRTKKKIKSAGAEMSTAEAAVATLTGHGINTVYALPGVHNDHLFDALQRAGDRLSVIHTRHEQGAAYMALGAALATGRPHAYAVVPGPGLLNSGAALLTAYGMNAPVLAMIGQIPAAAIGKSQGHLHEIRDQAGILARLVDHSFHIKGPGEASLKVAKAIQSMSRGRRGPAAILTGRRLAGSARCVEGCGRPCFAVITCIPALCSGPSWPAYRPASGTSRR